MALLDSKQLNPKLTGSFILSGSTQTFIGASDFQGSVTASGDISGSYTSTGSFGRIETSGDALIKGNLTFGDADSDSVSFGADISSSSLSVKLHPKVSRFFIYLLLNGWDSLNLFFRLEPHHLAYMLLSLLALLMVSDLMPLTSCFLT